MLINVLHLIPHLLSGLWNPNKEMYVRMTYKGCEQNQALDKFKLLHKNFAHKDIIGQKKWTNNKWILSVPSLFLSSVT
jgi:hypothetical protein